MIAAALLLLAFASLLMAGLLAGCEMGLYSLNRLRLRLRAEDPVDGSARRLQLMLGSQQETVLAVLVGQHLSGYLLTVATSEYLNRFSEISADHVELYSAAFLSPLIFVLGDVVPKNWFQADPDRLMYASARVMNWTVIALRATRIPWLLARITGMTVRLLGGAEQDALSGARGEIVGLLRESAAEGTLSEEQTRIVERVLNLADIHVGMIMVPRRRVAAVRLNADLEDIQRVVREHHYSRLPVIDPRDAEVVGIVNTYDLLNDEAVGSIERQMQSVVRLPASETAAGALVQLQQAAQPMAVVSDPRHGWVGIVTLKDIVEEIFGELPEA